MSDACPGVHQMHECAVRDGEFHQGFRGLPGLIGGFLDCSIAVFVIVRNSILQSQRD